MTRVHLVINSYPPSLGGAQLHTQALARELVKRGNAVRVSTLSRVTNYRWVDATTRDVPNATTTSQEDGVEVATAGMPKRSLLDPAWRRGYLLFRRASARHFAGQLDFECWGDVIHVIRQGREHLAWRAFMSARRAGIPLVLTANHHPRWSSWRPDPVWRRLYGLADRVVALTQVEADMLSHLGVSPDRIVVTGVGPILPQRTRTTAADHGSRYLLYLGQQFPYKRLDVAIRVLEDLRQDPQNDDLRLVVAGPTVPATYEAIERSTAFAQIEIRPDVDDDEKLDLLRGASLLVHPSEQESFGGVLVEAASVGLPIVCRGLPQLKEVVNRLGWGEVAESDEDFTPLAQRLLARPPSAGVKATATKCARETFGWAALAGQYEAVYTGLLRASNE